MIEVEDNEIHEWDILLWGGIIMGLIGFFTKLAYKQDLKDLGIKLKK